MATKLLTRAQSRAKRATRPSPNALPRRPATPIRTPQSPIDTFHAIEKGFPVSFLSTLSRESGISEAKLKSLARISSSTFARRQKSGRFSPEESDRLHRIRRVVQAAVELFDGDIESGARWLDSPAPALDDRKPIDLLGNSAGEVEVENLITGLGFGVFM